MALMNYQSMMANAYRAQAQAQEAYRKAKLLKEAKTDEAKLAAADKARYAGDIGSASSIYVRLALSAKNEHGDTAKERLTDLRKEGRERMAQIDSTLAEFENVSPGELNAVQPRIAEVFTAYKKLARDYSRVPQVGRDIKNRMRKQRAQPAIAAALEEPEAAQLWKTGQELEQQGSACCAYLIYEKAAKYHMPAPSALRAAQRLEKMKQKGSLVASAARCKDLQQCHIMYQQAERLAKVKPSRAREIFAQIVKRSPSDSQLHRAAVQQVSLLN